MEYEYQVIERQPSQEFFEYRFSPENESFWIVVGVGLLTLAKFCKVIGNKEMYQKIEKMFGKNKALQFDFFEKLFGQVFPQDSALNIHGFLYMELDLDNQLKKISEYVSENIFKERKLQSFTLEENHYDYFVMKLQEFSNKYCIAINIEGPSLIELLPDNYSEAPILFFRAYLSSSRKLMKFTLKVPDEVSVAIEFQKYYSFTTKVFRRNHTKLMFESLKQLQFVKTSTNIAQLNKLAKKCRSGSAIHEIIQESNLQFNSQKIAEKGKCYFCKDMLGYRSTRLVKNCPHSNHLRCFLNGKFICECNLKA